MRKAAFALTLLAIVSFFTSCPVQKTDPEVTPDDATYTVTYHAGNAEAGTVPGPQTKKKGEALVLASNSGGLSLAGMWAAGWNTQADGRGNDYPFGSRYSLDADLDLYVDFAPAELSAVQPSAGVLNKDFSPATTEYAVILADDVSSFSLNAAVPAGSPCTISYSVPQPMALDLGSNPLTVTVGIPGDAERVYSFDVRREGRFVTEWEIPSAGTSVTLPLDIESGNEFDCLVDWGDGTEMEAVTVEDTAPPAHIYAAPGRYQIAIQGTCKDWDFSIVATSKDLVRKVLSWGALPEFSGFRIFSFSSCVGLVSLATGGIKRNDLSSFYRAFSECSGLTDLPADLFRCTPAASDFSLTFNGCLGLTTIPGELFRDAIAARDFVYTFSDCAGLTTLPAELFSHNIQATKFRGVFFRCTGLTTLPADLFPHSATVTDYSSAFSGCSNLSSLPADLFTDNPAVTDFGYSFDDCPNLSSLPAGLFRNNIAAEKFSYAFWGCDKLVLRSDIFCQAGEEDTRFSGKSVDFSGCFYRSSPQSAPGTAPALWECTFGSVTSTGCFSGPGNSATTLSNFDDIPDEWK